MNDDMREFLIEKLIRLKLEAEFEDRKRGKIRYVKKTQAYQDLINLIQSVWREDDDDYSGIR